MSVPESTTATILPAPDSDDEAGAVRTEGQPDGLRQAGGQSLDRRPGLDTEHTARPELRRHDCAIGSDGHPEELVEALGEDVALTALAGGKTRPRHSTW